MTVPIVSVAQNADLSWTFSWTAVAGVSHYRIILWGRETDRTTVTTYTYPGNDYQFNPPPLEIVAGDAKTLSELYRPFAQLQWYDETCRVFNVYQFDGTNWNLVRSLPEGGWVYTFDTGTLVDETSYQFGVTAQDRIGQESGREEYDFLIVCPPVPPDGTIVLSYVQAGHQIQIAAAP